jgi:hypothetical protein
MQRPTMATCQLAHYGQTTPKSCANTPFLVKLEKNDNGMANVELKGTIITCNNVSCSAALSDMYGNTANPLADRLSGTDTACQQCTSGKFQPAWVANEYLGVVHDAQLSKSAVVACQVNGMFNALTGAAVGVN